MIRPRYGIWIPVYGTWGSRQHPDEPPDASYARAKALLQQAEAAGFATTLLAQHIINPFHQECDQLETWTSAAALAEATDRVEIIAAIKPLLFHPAVLAKMALGIDAISHGRFAINLVSAWYRPELEKAGIPFLPHDERYRYAAEWLRVVKALWSGEPVTLQGDYFRIDDLCLRPRPLARPHPPVYIGGESEPARRLGTQEADVFLINGRPIDQVREVVDDLARRPRRLPPLRFGISAFVIARPTEDDAQAEFARLLALVQADDRSELRRGLDRDVVMMQVNAEVPKIGTNGGTAAGLVGSYDTVAARIVAFTAIGIETFLLQFQPLEGELARFAAEVMPRVERALAVRV